MTTTVQYGSTDNSPNSRALAQPSAFLLHGENPLLQCFESLDGSCEYVRGLGATSAQDIALGGETIGNALETVWVFNNSGQSITALTIKDGGSLVIVPRAIQVPALPANGAYWKFSFDGGAVRSKVGGWKLNITCAGTMANIEWMAKGRFR